MLCNKHSYLLQCQELSKEERVNSTADPVFPQMAEHSTDGNNNIWGLRTYATSCENVTVELLPFAKKNCQRLLSLVLVSSLTEAACLTLRQ